ncbi:hypothetical protein HYV64_00645 [Candidatus Shapirobacteria bacterium]|nr:hypothetical protein [Candidatus Shapirobacteria bacterium]
MKNGSFLSAIFLMFMGTVGSGIFVLPYLFYHSNFIFAVFFLLILGLVTGVLNHFYAHIVTSTSGDHQLAGYARIYLGHRFASLATLNLLLLSFGAIAVYLKLFVSFISLLFPTFSPFLLLTFYFLLLSLLYFLYFHPSPTFDFIIPVFMLLIPIFLFVYSFRFSLLTINYSLLTSPSFKFFGATIYALSGFTIIPEVQEILLKDKKHRHSLPLVVTLGMIMVIFCYLMFIYGVIAISNGGVSIDAVTGLSRSTPLLAKIISGFGAVIVMRASFGFLIVLRELFFRDLSLPKNLSNILPLSFPILALTLGSISLISLISLTGNITIFVSALLICLIRLRLPTTFWTQFWVLLVLISLFLGLVINFIF